MDSNRDIYFHKLLEYTSVISGGVSIIDIVDIEGYEIEGLTLTVAAAQDPDNAAAFLISLDGGDTVSIAGEHQYFWLTSDDYSIRLKFYVENASTVAAKILGDGTGFNMLVYTISYSNDESKGW